MLTRFFFFALLALASVVSAQTTPTLETLFHFDSLQSNGPSAAFLLNAEGTKLYGTTKLAATGSSVGAGSIFSLNAEQPVNFNVLHPFVTATGSEPVGALVADSANDDDNDESNDVFYGVTTKGGVDSLGTIYKVSASGVHTVLFEFTNSTRTNYGVTPNDGLLLGPDGYLYGTTSLGGVSTSNQGTIFKMQPNGTSPIRVIDFSGDKGNFRGSKASTLTLGKDGNFYGVTEGGGKYNNGTIFRLTQAGVFKTIKDLGQSDASKYRGPKVPRAALVQDKNGIFYGTSESGGTAGNGTVFSITTGGTLKVLVNFTGTSGNRLGAAPVAGVILATDGKLYGATSLGGTENRGALFRVATNGNSYQSLIQFTGGLPSYGANPSSKLVQDNKGHLYGNTLKGGENGLGTTFRLDNALPEKAIVRTNAVTNPKGGTHATLSGTVTPRGTTALYWFEYGTTTSYGDRWPLAPLSAGSGSADVTKTATIKGLLPSTTYHYRMVVSNGGGTEWGNDEAFTTSSNPNILSAPVDQLVAVGSQASFAVNVVAANPKYRWLKEGSATALGTLNSYSITKTKLTSAGDYSVRITDGSYESLTTAPVRLGVVDTRSANLTVNEEQTTELKLPYAGTGMTFQWKVGNVDVQNLNGVSGATTPVLRISQAKLDDDQVYYCAVKMGTLELASGNFDLTVNPLPVVTTASLGTWVTNGQVDIQISATNVPTRFNAVGLPTGVTLNAKTGRLTGLPLASGTYPIDLSATNSAGTGAVQPITVLIQSGLVEESGRFVGLTERSSAGNDELGGWIDLTLSAPKSTGSGTLIHLGKTYSFTAALGQAPGLMREVKLTGKTGFPAVSATLTAASNTVTGVVNGSPFLAKRVVPASVAQVSRYTVALDLPQARVGDVVYPQGSGYAAVKMDAAGKVTWVGKMADGSDTLASSALTFDGTFPVHHALYATTGRGSAQGWVSVDSVGDALTSVAFDWIKKPQASTVKAYQAGFSLQLLELVGGRYTPPASSSVHVLGLTATTSNAELLLSEGGLTASLQQLFDFPASNAIKFPSPNASAYSLKITPSTGVFNGSLTVLGATPAENRKLAPMAGVLLQGSQTGAGYFILPQLPLSASSPKLSGYAEIATPVP